MARIRTIKPEFWSSEQVVECSRDARLLFVGLWNFSDDAGRHRASTKRLKMEVFPGDNLDDSEIRGWIDELLQVGLLWTYTVAEQEFWQVTGWRHQRVDRPTYRHPPPADSANTPRGVDEALPPESNGTESNGVESNGTESNGKETKVNGRLTKRSDHLEIDWEDAAFTAERVSRRVAERMGEWDNWHVNNRRMLLEAVAIVQLQQMPEAWLIDALEGVRLVKKIKKSPGARLCTCLQAGAQKISNTQDCTVFTRLRAAINVPNELVEPKESK